PALSKYFGYFALILCFGAVNAYLAQVLVGYKDVARSTIITNFINSPVMMILSMAFITVGYGLRGYLLAQVAGAFIVTILLFATAWKLTPRSVRAFSHAIPPLHKQVLTFSGAVIAMQLLEFLMSQSDKIFIGIYLRPEDVGVYAVAASLVAF